MQANCIKYRKDRVAILLFCTKMVRAIKPRKSQLHSLFLYNSCNRQRARNQYDRTIHHRSLIVPAQCIASHRDSHSELMCVLCLLFMLLTDYILVSVHQFCACLGPGMANKQLACILHAYSTYSTCTMFSARPSTYVLQLQSCFAAIYHRVTERPAAAAAAALYVCTSTLHSVLSLLKKRSGK